jgi:histidine ammonia-lyase
MGSISGRKALQVIDNLEKILAIELLTAAQAFEYRKPMKSGILLDKVHKELRKRVSFAKKDRVFADDIEIGISMIKDRTIMKVIEKTKKEKKISFKTPYFNEFEVF